jgi:YD repeat-containing protein
MRLFDITDGVSAGLAPYSNNTAVEWVYDNQMNVTEIESAGGTVTQYLNYDERGNPGTVTLALGESEERVINFTYHPFINTPLTRTEPSVLYQPGGLKETIWDYDDDYNSIPNENPTANVSRIIVISQNTIMTFPKLTIIRFGAICGILPN